MNREFSSVFQLILCCLLTVKMQSVPNKPARFMSVFYFFSFCLIKLINV